MCHYLTEVVDYAITPTKTEGWIAPNGRFYPCKFREHLELAERLSVVYYGTTDGPRDLEKHGWIKVYLDGRTNSTTDDRCTQKQLDTLFWLTDALTVDDEWKENLNKEIRKYKV